jgi:hypothetical protein
MGGGGTRERRGGRAIERRDGRIIERRGGVPSSAVAGVPSGEVRSFAFTAKGQYTVKFPSSWRSERGNRDETD